MRKNKKIIKNMKRIGFLTENSISLKKYMNYGKKMTYWSCLNISKWVRISKEHYDILLEKKKLKTIVIKQDFITIQKITENKQQKFKHKLWKKIKEVRILYTTPKGQLWGFNNQGKKMCILKLKKPWDKEIILQIYLGILENHAWIAYKYSRYFTQSVKFKIKSENEILINSYLKVKNKKKKIPILWKKCYFKENGYELFLNLILDLQL